MERRGTRHIDSLDGLRAFAIAAVVLYHLSVPWLPSGHMGVVVFLVLTGYLVTNSLLRARRRTGRVPLVAFWARRLRRIWPPMALAVLVTTVLCLLFNRVLLTKLRPDFLPSLLLCSNVASILRGASYFDHLGGTSPLTHLWYLGLDAQFCLAWPFVVTALSRWGNGVRSRVPRVACGALALASAVEMALLFDPNADPTRVYYGPDTRVFAPLVGAWLAYAWPLGKRPHHLLGQRRLTMAQLRGRLTTVGALGLAGLLAIMLLVPDTSPFLYRGGMLVATIASAALLCGLMVPGGILNRIFSARPLAWLGKRAFGVYLWHYPLFQLLRVTESQTPWWIVLLAIALSVGLAELSLRLVEQPLSRPGSTSSHPSRRPALVVAAALAVVAVVGLLAAPEETALPSDAIHNTGSSASQGMDLSGTSQQAETTSDTGGRLGSTDADNLPDGSITLLAKADDVSQGVYAPVVIADSVAGDADWYFKEHVRGGLLDSYVGRRPDQGLSVLKDYLSQNAVGNVVVLDCFSNVPATDDVMDELVEACGDRAVYLVNVRIPEREETQINESIERVAEKHDNAHVIDWHTASEGHDDWIYEDGEHLTPEGQPHYIDLITNAIERDFVKRCGGSVLSEDEADAAGSEEESQVINSERTSTDDTAEA